MHVRKLEFRPIHWRTNYILVANAYNFTGSGETSYTIAPSTLFYYIDADTNELLTINAETVQKHTAKLSGTLAVVRRELDKRITYSGCSTSEESALVSAAAAAQTYAENAQTYVSLHSRPSHT